ncbi:unnamed protein product [Linum tenue]|uniref:Uncharacterized protein n=1 Tax=Linum tenue TaxID=586396 RepID=A0AAV0PVQ4_9ROSI|nr:unnamed protein product [Linum tenue]CAI0420483.1 unnamed protein product [Linum tenue]CAI0460752.1 unnamed protein product [Linum tenue]CAI0474829.1 unnamed protein product [Linum tenue]
MVLLRLSVVTVKNDLVVILVMEPLI